MNDEEAMKDDAEQIKFLESRLKQSESELEAVVKERDLYNKNYLALESRLKEAGEAYDARGDELEMTKRMLKHANDLLNEDKQLIGQNKLEELQERLSQAEAETERFKSKWAKYVDHFWCDCGLTDEQRDKGEDCTFEGTKTCGYCMAKIQKGRINELKSRLSHLMDVGGKLSESLQAMTADAHELRAINRQNLGAKRDEKINATYYEDIKKAESLIAEWDGIKKEGGE